MTISFHNHTTFSDGTATIAEMAGAAHAAGLTEFGISDHLVIPPSGPTPEWAMDVDRLATYVSAVQSAASRAQFLDIRLGLEVDFFPENIRDVRAMLRRLPADYLIGAVHFVDGFPVDADAEHWEALSLDERDDIWRRYWIRIRELGESGAFDVVAHLDVPRKFGHYPRTDFTAEIGEALDAIAASGMAIEINTAGWRTPSDDAYPAFDILSAARARDIRLQINADAHRPDDVAFEFPRAVALARRAGYSRVVGFREGVRYMAPLS